MKRVLILLNLFSIQVVLAQATLATSLTACYALNGNASEPISNLTGTLTAVTPTVDRFNAVNSAYHFAGTIGSYIELPNSPLIKPNAVSFSSWVRFDAMNNGQYVVFTGNTCGSFHEGYTLVTFFTGGTYRFQAVKSFSTCSGANQITINGTTLLSSSTWYHVGFYIGADSMKLYVNGLLEAATANSNPIIYDPLKSVFLGGSGQAFNLPMQGTIDNVRFYNRKLTGTEFNQLYTLDPSCIAAIGSPPVVSFSVSTVNVCAGNSISMMDLSSNSPSGWNWQIPGALPPTAAVSNPTIAFLNPGNYIVSLVSSNTVGASNTATQTIVVLPNPTITVTANSPVICSGQNTNLFAGGASSFTWSTMQTGLSINVSPLVNSIYTVTGSDNNGCINTGLILVTVNPLPNVLLTPSQQQICQGQSSTLTASGANSYTWNTLQFGSSVVVSPNLTTLYLVNGTDVNNCSNSVSVSIQVSALPTILATSSKSTICRGQAVTLTASGGVTYTWSTTQQSISITVSPQTNTTYTLSGTGSNGCKNNGSITVFVSDCVGLSQVENGNAFSVYPNPGNGVYELQFSESKSGVLRIYNSLSQMIYEKQFENEDHHAFDITDRANGIYHLKVITLDQTIYRKIIKN